MVNFMVCELNLNYKKKANTQGLTEKSTPKTPVPCRLRNSAWRELVLSQCWLWLTVSGEDQERGGHRKSCPFRGRRSGQQVGREC